MSYFKSHQDVFYYFFNLDEKGHGDPCEFADALQSIGRFYGFTPKNLAMMLHRTAKYITGTRIAPAAKASLLDVLQEHIHPWADNAFEFMDAGAQKQFNGQYLANIAYAQARMNFSLGTEFWDAWRSAAIHTMQRGEMNGQDLANSLWSMATLGVVPDEDFMRVWRDAAIHIMQRGGMNGQNLANSLWSMATLGIMPDDKFMGVWQDTAIRTMQRGGMNGQALSNSLWAMAMIDTLRFDSQHHHTAFTLMQGILNGHDDKAARIQAEQARYYFGFDRFPATPWVERQRCSESEKRLARQFGRVAAVDCDYYIPSLGHRPDMLVTHNGKECLAEYDGPRHFVGDAYNGGTLLMSSLMRDAAPDKAVIRVPYTVEDIMKFWSEDDQDRAWAGVLGQLETGRVYTVRLGDAYTLHAELLLPVIDYRQASARAYNIGG